MCNKKINEKAKNGVDRGRGMMIGIFLIWNIAIFLIYGMDKFFAMKKCGRVPESVLILTAMMMGGIGAFFGMNLFRHKTRKLKFRILIPICAVINIVCLVFVFLGA